MYIAVELIHASAQLSLPRCIFDTGAAGTTFDVDQVASIGLTLTAASRVKRLATIGGYQRVFTRVVDSIQLGDIAFAACEIEIGELTSQFHIDGIIGTDLIRQHNWRIDFGRLRLSIETG